MRPSGYTGGPFAIGVEGPSEHISLWNFWDTYVVTFVELRWALVWYQRLGTFGAHVEGGVNGEGCVKFPLL